MRRTMFAPEANGARAADGVMSSLDAVRDDADAANAAAAAAVDAARALEELRGSHSCARASTERWRRQGHAGWRARWDRPEQRRPRAAGGSKSRGKTPRPCATLWRQRWAPRCSAPCLRRHIVQGSARRRMWRSVSPCRQGPHAFRQAVSPAQCWRPAIARPIPTAQTTWKAPFAAVL